MRDLEVTVTVSENSMASIERGGIPRDRSGHMTSLEVNSNGERTTLILSPQKCDQLIEALLLCRGSAQ